MLLSTPIRWYWATTAALTMLATISTAIAIPIRAKATMNGWIIGALPAAFRSESSQEAAPVTAPVGSSCLISVMSDPI